MLVEGLDDQELQKAKVAFIECLDYVPDEQAEEEETESQYF